MKLIYLSRVILPSQSASSVQVINTSQALEGIIDRFRLYAFMDGSKNEILNYYGLSNLSVLHLNLRKVKILQLLIHLLPVLIRNRGAVYFTRTPRIATMLKFFKCAVFLELHQEIKLTSSRLKLLNNLDGIFTITESLKNHYIKCGVSSDKIKVLPDGAHAINDDKKRIHVPKGFNIGYVGSFKKGKGVELIIDISKSLPEYNFHLVGGNPDELKLFKENAGSNVHFHGHVANSEVYRYILSFDVLLLPNQKEVIVGDNVDIGKYTSPLKLFEYMSSGVPFICSDLEVLKEVVNEKICYLANPDEVESWTETIREIVKNHDLARNKAALAAKEFNKYTWDQRARNIVEAIGEI